MMKRPMTRSLKLVPNEHIQYLFTGLEVEGFDGELIVGNPTDPGVFNRTSSGVMSVEGAPQVTFWVFDDFTKVGGFINRLAEVSHRIATVNQPFIKLVPHVQICDEEELFHQEQEYLKMGYEGMMLRRMDGWYKDGRSTKREMLLLKLKRFVDSEAQIIGYTQLMINSNEGKKNALGHLERSNKKAGLVPAEMLGSLLVKDIRTGAKFEIGTGFTRGERKELWILGDNLLNRLVKYKSQPSGVKDKPRFPVFLGFRDLRDL